MLLILMLYALAPMMPGAPALSDAMAAATLDKAPDAAVKWVAPDQAEAGKRAQEVVPFVGEVMDECRLCRQQRLRDAGLGVQDQEHSYYLLDSPILKKLEKH